MTSISDAKSKPRKTLLGKAQRDKGAREERKIAALLGATKISAMHKPGPDLEMPDGRTVEVKVRASSFKMIYKWLEPVDILVIRADREEPLIVITLSNFMELSGTLE